jgi:hypothetical protein
MNWVLLIGAVWLIVAVLVGVLIGRGIRLADRKEEEAAVAEATEPNFVVDPDATAPDAIAPRPPVRGSERARSPRESDMF